MELFEKAWLGSNVLRNRIIRAPTFEGRCDENGFPTIELEKLYCELAKNHVGAIITGFSSVSRDGRSTMLGHCEIDTDNKIESYQKIVTKVHKQDCKIYMQLVHQGRQTSLDRAGGTVYSATGKKSMYYKAPVRQLTTEQAYEKIDAFIKSAWRAKEAGFDGVEIHAAHGNLIHEFIMPSLNKRKDIFGIGSESGIGTMFLQLILTGVRKICGKDFTIIVKISGSDDYARKFSAENFSNLIRFLDASEADAIEIGYGTLDNALNVFRGETIPVDAILKYNPRYKTENRIVYSILRRIITAVLNAKTMKFTPMYNLHYAKTAKKLTTKPIISVGGFRTGSEMAHAVSEGSCDFISLCRPFICEPDFAMKLEKSNDYTSRCINCNICAIMSETERIVPTRCYQNNN